MKKVLLSLAAFAALSASAQTVYNYFDPADCDGEGWLWFNTQEKIDKYVGTADKGKFKLQLETNTIMDEWTDSYADPDILGYNAEGVEGGEGSWKGAIVLSDGSKNIGMLGDADGGGIYMALPDCAEMSFAFSTAADNILVCLFAARENEAAIQDLSIVQGYVDMGLFGKPLAKSSQYKWLNVQNIKNTNFTPALSVESAAGNPVTVLLRNNKATELLVQGIKIMTYTQTEYPGGSGVNDIIADDANAPVEFFNMQGVKVSGDEPGLYIRRQGAKVSKVIL